MAVQEKLLTAEEFAQLPSDGKKYDLVKGVLVEVALPNAAHHVLQVGFAYSLRSYIASYAIGTVLTETGHILFRNPDVVRSPDVAFIAKARFTGKELSGFVPMGPDLAVNIVSPNDLVGEMMTKIQQYFRAGTRLIWVVYPDTKQVYVYDGSSTNIKVVDINGTLDGGDVLPGFTLPVTKLFQVLGD